MTPLDKALLLRVARILEEEAVVVKRSHEPWTSASESRLQKKRHDRLLRDANDVREYVRRTPIVDPAKAVAA